jgi:hypothetical protein
MRARARGKWPAAVLLSVLLALAGAAAAGATAPAAHLALHVQAAPTHLSSADSALCVNEEGAVNDEPACDRYLVTVTNTGSRAASGPIVLADAVPPGLKVVNVKLFWFKSQLSPFEKEGPEGEQLTVNAAEEPVCKPEAVPVSCQFEGKLEPDQRLQMQVIVTVDPEAEVAPNTATVSQEGNVVASTSANDVVSSSPAPFGPGELLSDINGPDGAPDVQAGDHPYEFVTRIDLNNRMTRSKSGAVQPGPGQRGIRDVVVDLPVGFLGSATSTPTCTYGELQSRPGSCPRDTMVGHIETEGEHEIAANSPIFNMVPPHGVAAEFGFIDFLATTHVFDASVVPTPHGYVLRAVARELPWAMWTDIITTLYGNPSERDGATTTPLAQFTNPSDCSGRPLVSTVYLDSWEHPATFNPDGSPNVEGPGSSGWASASSQSPPVTGCDRLRFAPSAFSFQPETTAADSPTGATFDLKLPQPQTPGTLATPPLRNATVTLPAGLTVDPSAASGLAACSPGQIGWEGGSPTSFTEAAPTCPEASRIASVQVTSPLLADPLTGSVYLATQYENPFGSLLAGYIVIDDPATGTIVKIAGELRTDPATGQITGVFDESPQLPFSELKIHFFGGSRGVLATPQSCGVFTTTSDLMPWSAPASGPDATPSSSFAIDSGCGFGFAPAFSAGTLSNQAAAFSPVTLTLARQDGEQHLSGLTVTTPPGLLGSLKGIPLCAEAQANAGTCDAASQIGETTVTSGVGPDPYVVGGGRVYLTGPYGGGPFGLSVVIPAVAGPFDLGNVVVRSSIRIDRHTGQITVVTDPLPQMVNSVEGLRSGFPADVRSIVVTINRPGFTFNASSCERMRLTGSVSGAQGASVPVSSSYQAANCQGLPFKPRFSASTSGHTSRANGASLNVRITSAGIGQANIAKVDLTIPSVLPSRLTTLQKACSEAQFDANPAGCPPASVIATATVHTPLLNGPLSGPVYFVSHGGAAFPDTVILLQGEGVTLLLEGHTDIRRGVTYSRFESVPDAPFTSFEFHAPQGPFSIFAASANLCDVSVHMPTRIVAQNGVVREQSTLVEPEGCPYRLTILSHRVKGRTVTLKVAVPAAGSLTASGRHLTRVTRTVGGRSTITLSLRGKGHGRLRTRVTLTFVPRSGRTLSAAATARLTR